MLDRFKFYDLRNKLVINERKSILEYIFWYCIFFLCILIVFKVKDFRRFFFLGGFYYVIVVYRLFYDFYVLGSVW